MSKNFGKSRRPAPEKGDEKRPSVFERLGVRSRDNSNSSFNQSDSYGNQAPRRQDMKQGHHNVVRDSRPRGVNESKRRSRSQSYSPPPPPMNKISSRKKFDDTTTSHTLKSSKIKDIRSAGVSSVGSNRPVSKKATKDSVKHKVTKLEQIKHSSKKEKEKKRSGGGNFKKVLIEKKKRKGRTSSVSSADSSGDGSYSSSSSSKSSTSSSSSSNNSSSSESSVPSVKLKSEKTKVKKKKLKVKPDKKVQIPKTTSSSRSSSSGMDALPTSNVKRTLPVDLREKLNARSPSGIKDQYHSKDPRSKPESMKRVKPYEKDSPAPEDDRYIVKKRPFPQEPYMSDDVKRRRLLSPPPTEKYRQPIENSPHHHRRAPPQVHEAPKRGRTPTGFQKDPHIQRAAPMPIRRPRVDDTRRPDRPDFRNEGDKRNSMFNQGMKFDRHREPDFGRDSHRPRERVAPSRPPMDNRQERDRNVQNDFQRRPRVPPFNNPLEHNRAGGIGFRGQGPLVERDRPRFGGAGPADEKRLPLLPKSKEALAERYELMKKSGYVDKWVDETVKTVQVQRKVDEIEPIRPPLLPLPLTRPSYPVVVERIEKPKVEESVKEQIPETVIVEAEDLSDFSDDADEILNNEESPKNSLKDSVGPCETPSASDIDESQKKEPIVESPSVGTPIQVRSDSIEKAPSIASQERTIKTFVPEGKSLPSQSQTDDDILERMDFEEISEDELGEVENKVCIVDALGVDWASLVCQEKQSDPQAAVSESSSSSARKRWDPLHMLSRVGISKSLAGENLYQRIIEMKMKGQSDSSSTEIQRTEECQDDKNLSSKNSLEILDRIGLGPNSRALSSRRDMAVRRCFLGLPRKSLLSMDLRHQASSNVPPIEMTTIGELYKLSIALFKPLNEGTTLS